MILFLRANFLIVVASLALLTGVNLPAFSQTIVTASTPVTFCVGATQTLPIITVSEGNNGDFAKPQTNQTFVLTAPVGFEFVSFGFVSFSGDVVSASVQSLTSTSLTLLISTSNVLNIPSSFSITNLQVRATGTNSTGDIFRTLGNPGMFDANGLGMLGDAEPGSGISYGSLTANPAASLSGVSQSISICEGGGATIDLTGLVPGSTSTVDYSINGVAQISATGVVANVGGAGSFLTASLLSSNNGQLLQVTGVTITSSSPYCTKAFSNGAVLNINSAPVVTTQPIVTQTVCEGSNVTVSVTASGAGVLSYQWKRGAANVGVNS
ncbi:MAG: hypothetical protein IM631_08225, partial [Cytophagales bacterium]|nr:hypothetical protein [Cytophagales bacterium]